jgi:acyl dehydratase
MSENETVYFEDLKEGQELPPFERRTDFANWNRYAAVNDEFVAIHMDDEAGRAAGMTGAFGMGNLRYAYLHNLLRDWIGIEGDLRRVSIQYRGLNYKNDVLTCRGRVTRKYEEDGERLIDLEVWVENQRGEIVSPGQATVALPSRSV